METYEKKYKELEGKIKKAYLYAQTDSTKAVLEDILPELKESEEERIRKELKHYLEVRRCQTKDNEEYMNCNHFLAWLEKQGNKPQGKTALESIKEKPADNANKVASALSNVYNNCYIQAVEKACEWLYQRQAVDLEVRDMAMLESVLNGSNPSDIKSSGSRVKSRWMHLNTLLEELAKVDMLLLMTMIPS